MSDERCIHDMLPGQCGDCRGLKSVEEHAAVDTQALRQRLLSGAGGRHWREAKFPGRCAGCSEWFQVGAAIRCSTSSSGWVAECCAKGDNDSG